MTAWPYLDIEQSVDYYKVYTNQDEFILNTWYFSHTIFNKISKVYSDELICLKECDDLTTLWLCGKKINPVVLRIHPPLGGKFKQNKRGEDFVLCCLTWGAKDISYN